MKTSLGVLVVSATLCVACGGNDSGDFSGAAGAAGNAGAAGGRADGGGGTSTSSAGRAGVGASSPGGAGSGSGGSESGGAASGEAGSGPTGEGGKGDGSAGAGGSDDCADVFGEYDILSAQGDCGDLDTDAAQGIEGSLAYCALHFVSDGGVNGGAEPVADGSFSGTQLYLGSAQRSPCSGTWSAQNEVMLITCGGKNDACIVMLERIDP